LNEHKSFPCIKYAEYDSGDAVRQVVKLNREEPLPALPFEKKGRDS
jgi:hypothetical protein